MPRRQAHEDQQLLSRNEEYVLFKRCQALTRADFPLQPSALRQMVAEIQKGRVASNTAGSEEPVQYPTVGIHWARGFLDRYPRLKSVFSRQIDLSRWRDPTRKVLRAWFKAFSKATRGILQKNIYNMDESGFSIGSTASMRVIIDPQTSGTRYCAHPGRQG